MGTVNRYARLETRSAWHWLLEEGQVPSNEVLRTMAAVETVQALDRVVAGIDRLISRLDSLGADGIHEVIREARQQVRGLRRKRLATKPTTVRAVKARRRA
jgi:hypothetical protein